MSSLLSQTRSIQVVILVILRAFCRELQRQPVVGELIQPDTLGDRDGACQTAPCHRTALMQSPASQLPAGIDKAAERLLASQKARHLNFFTPMPRPACTSSIFMNVSFLVVLLTAILFRSLRQQRRSSSEVAEHCISCRPLDRPFDVGCNCTGVEGLVRRLTDFGLLLRFVGAFFAAQTGATENRSLIA